MQTVVTTSPVQAVAAAEGVTAVPGGYCILNPNTFSILDGIAVSTNGQLLDGGMMRDYGRFRRLYDLYTQNDGWDRSKLLYEVTTALDADACRPSAPAIAPDAASKMDKVPIQITSFPGTFLTAKPEILDTSLAPLRLTARFAPAANAFLAKTAADLNVVYNQTVLTFDTIVLADNTIYNAAVADKLANGGTIDVVYDKWSVYTQGAGSVESSLNFSVNSSCVKSLLGVFCKNFEAKPWAHDGSSMTTAFQHFGIGTGSTLSTSWFQVGTQPFPSFQPKVYEMFDQTIRNFKPHSVYNQISKLIGSEDAYLQLGGAAHLITMGLPEDEDTKRLRLRDGLDVYGADLTISWVTSGTDGDATKLPTKAVLVRTIPIVQIGEGRQVQLVL
jgi:hypothetical protein